MQDEYKSRSQLRTREYNERMSQRQMLQKLPAAEEWSHPADSSLDNDKRPHIAAVVDAKA